MAVGPVGKSGGTMVVFVMNLLTDLAFNLLIFFVVCASTAPEKGRQQQMPSASKEKADEQKAQNIEVAITRTGVSINGSDVPKADFQSKLKVLLTGKSKPEERIVVVRSDNDTPYQHWIAITVDIERAGGVITLQLEEEKEIGVR
jgi:biopolymer transport protein ExbD